MDVAFFILAILLEFFAPVVLAFALICGIFLFLRARREGKSLFASWGDKTAGAMERLRLAAWVLKALGVLLFPVILVVVAASSENLTAGFVVAAVVSGILFALARAITKSYNAQFKDNYVKAELAKVFANLQYEPHGSFDQQSLTGLDFFTAVDKVDGNDLIVADYKGKHFSQCDLDVKDRYTVTVRDKNGKSHEEVRWQTIFRGRAMRFDFANEFRGRVQVVSRDFEGAKVKFKPAAWQPVETELAEFNDRFEVFSVDPADAMTVLTPQMVEGIFYLGKALDVPTALYFSGNTMFAFLVTGREAFDVSNNRTLLEERGLLRRDVALATGFLDTMYFKPQATASEAAPAKAGVESKTITERAAEAEAIANAAGPTEGEKILREAKRVSGKAVGIAASWLPIAIIAAFLVSAIVALTSLPDGISLGASYSGGEWNTSDGAMSVPTLGYLIVGGLFIVATAFGAPVMSLILLALHLLFLSVNLA